MGEGAGGKRRRTGLVIGGIIGLLAIVPASWALASMTQQATPTRAPSSHAVPATAAPAPSTTAPSTPPTPIAARTSRPTALPPAPASSAAPQQSVQARPIPLPPPAASQPLECPNGAVSARLDSITVQPTYGTDYAAAFHGTLSNNTSGDVLLGSHAIPRIQGLDNAGNSVLGTVLGEYDQTPPPGKPKASDLVLGAGQTIGFTASKSPLYKETLSQIQFWYIDAAPGSIPNLVFNDGRLTFNCSVRGDRQGGGQSTPNTYR